MKGHPKEVELQRAAALAIGSLARLEANRESLGTAGATEMILAAFIAHNKSEGVVAAVIAAIDRLCLDSVNNKQRFLKGNVVDLLIGVYIFCIY